MECGIGDQQHRARQQDRSAQSASRIAPSTIGFHRDGIRNAMTAPAAQRMKNAAKSWAVVLMPAPQLARARGRPAPTVAFSRRRASRPWRIANGGGGHPGTTTSTGMISAAPPDGCKARTEHAAGNGASPDRHDALRRRHRLVGLAATGSRMASETGPATNRISALRGVGVMKKPRRCML